MKNKAKKKKKIVEENPPGNLSPETVAKIKKLIKAGEEAVTSIEEWTTILEIREKNKKNGKNRQ